jgi:diguanylate cyclase (GGDEF)-like protein/PAS domain S-box-containing protein
MAKKNTIKLLLINESDNEGERLISLFRNAGRVARAKRAQSAEELFRMLEQDSWDLLIANDKHPEIVVDQCLELLKKHDTIIPSIVIRDGDANSALDAGACDVIASDDDKRLMFAALRELRSFDDRRQLISTKEKLSDAVERCNLLMADSQEALAYVADGMLISSNALFCARFGYADPEELDCTPVIDLIAPSDNSKFKQLLKTLANGNEDGTDFDFTGQTQDGETFTAAMHLSTSVFDDEPCIQLTINDSEDPKTSTESEAVSSSTSEPKQLLATLPASNTELLTQLTMRISQAADGDKLTTLAFISIDGIDDIRSRVGITQTDHVLTNISDFVSQQLASSTYLSQYCDDGLVALLDELDASSAQKAAEQLCSNIESHIVEIGGQSIQCTASIGLVVIDGQQSDNSAKCIDNAFSACEIVRKNGGCGVMPFVTKKEKKSLGNAAGDQELDKFLEEALNNGQFSLSYQPVVSLRGTSGEHYEVRTTMTTDDGEILEASQFSDNIQFSGINTRLDRWIILEATKKLAAQIEQHQDVRLFINLSANSLQDESLIPWLGVVVKAGGISPSALIFQFSAPDISDYLKPAISFSELIRELGCKISITGFGKATDPFKVLNHIQADFAKISDSFTEQLEPGGDAQLLKAMVSSIGENDIQAIISGVENAAALAQLWQIGVDYIQGGYLAGPSKIMDYEFTDIA